MQEEECAALFGQIMQKLSRLLTRSYGNVEVLESDQTQSVLSEKKIQWKFIVEKAPWWGGFYERLIKSVKTPLKKLFAKATLDAEQLTTILAEI